MRNLKLIIIFLFVAVSYYLLATKGTGKFAHDLDYFNPLAKSFLSARLDIPNPIENHDLSFFEGKWYPYWGPLPALLLIPSQLVMHRYIPADYLAIFAGSIGVVLMYLIIKRVGKEYFDDRISEKLAILITVFFAFGTSQVYVSTRSGVWFISQVVSMVPTLAAFYILLKKKLDVKDYFWSSFLISTNFIDRLSFIFLGVFLVFRLFDDFRQGKRSLSFFKKKIIVTAIPFFAFLLIFAWYNFARFGNVWDNGFMYHNNGLDPVKYFPYGLTSIQYIPRNLWLIFLEIPKLTLWKMCPSLQFNMEGISIFAVSPVYLAAILTLRKKIQNRLVIYLWITFLFLLFPILLLFSPGLVQFGIRYSLDFSMILITLALFGLEGKGNVLVLLATAIAVVANLYSVMIL